MHNYQQRLDYHNTMTGKKENDLSFQIFILAILVSSTFYVVPLSRFEYFGTDFRLFDFVFAFFFLTVGLNKLSDVIQLLKKKKTFFWWISILLVLVWFSLAMTFATGGTAKVLPAIIRGIRFTAYLFTGVYVVVLVDTSQKFRWILRILYINIIIQAALSTAQRLGWLGSLWPYYYTSIYGELPVGTLSAHHKQIGVVMLIGLGISLSYIRTRKNIFTRFINIFFMGLMISASVFAVSRTAWLGMAGMALGYFFIYKNRSIGMLILLIIGLFSSFFLLERIGVDISGVLQEDINRVFLNRIEQQGLEGVAGDRFTVYETVPERIARNPWILLIGTGFQNQSTFFYGSGAHNNYLHVWMELGIFGFIIYMGMLHNILLDLRKVRVKVQDSLENTYAQDVFAVFVGILFTMLVGETLWAQPSMQTMTAQIMIMVGLGVAPFYFDKNFNDEKKQIDFRQGR